MINKTIIIKLREEHKKKVAAQEDEESSKNGRFAKMMKYFKKGDS